MLPSFLGWPGTGEGGGGHGGSLLPAGFAGGCWSRGFMGSSPGHDEGRAVVLNVWGAGTKQAAAPVLLFALW